MGGFEIKHLASIDSMIVFSSNGHLLKRKQRIFAHTKSIHVTIKSEHRRFVFQYNAIHRIHSNSKGPSRDHVNL